MRDRQTDQKPELDVCCLPETVSQYKIGIDKVLEEQRDATA